MPLADGEVFAGYTVVRLLGVGGMGEVYLAQHPRLPRQDALKVLGPAVSADPEYRQRFNLEAEMVSTLRHPHIVTIHDRGDFDGQLWIAMEFVDGTDAGVLLQKNPNGIPPVDLVRIVTAVADALDYAHSRQVLHRDIKPANILVGVPESGDRRVLLADFGVARRTNEPNHLTGVDMTVGTVTYAAPEQLMGEDIDGRADQYALAATAYHMLTGAAPFTNSNPAVVIGQHLSAAPPLIDRPDLSRFGPVFGKALAKKPADRYGRCADFATALRDALEAATVTPRHRKPEHSGSVRGPVRWIAAGTVALVVLAGAVLLFVNRSAPAVAPPPPAVSARMDLPVVVMGADCAVLGAAGVTETGAEAYCSRDGSTGGATVWSTLPERLRAPS